MKRIRWKLTAHPQKELAFKNYYTSGRVNEISVFLSLGMLHFSKYPWTQRTYPCIHPWPDVICCIYSEICMIIYTNVSRTVFLSPFLSASSNAVSLRGMPSPLIKHAMEKGIPWRMCNQQFIYKNKLKRDGRYAADFFWQ